MPTRTVAVTLTAQVSGYIAGMEQARKKTGEVSDEAQKKLEAQGKAFGELGGMAMRFGAVAAAGILLAIARFAEFDAAMSNVQAATHETTENMDLLREAALEAGASTVYTATEAASAIEELSKAGVETADILGGGLTGALNLAAAGEMDVAAAAEIAATAMVIFKREGSEVPHIADLLAAAAGKAQGSVEDMSFALKQSALVAAQMGISVEDTTAGLALFAANGLLGSDAGTSFRTMLLALNPKSKEAAETMNDLGFSAYDQQGNFIGLAAVADELQKSLAGMSKAQQMNTLQIVFGQDAIRAATVLYDAGSKGVNEWVEKVNDSGYAAQTAALRLDNLKGDVEKLGGAFDTALIRSGSGANDVLRGMVQSLTFLVDSVGSLPQPVLNAGMAFSAVGAAMLLVGGATLTMVPKFAALKAQVALTGVSMGTFALRTLAIGGALGVATIAVGLFVARQAEAAATTREFQSSLDQVTGATTNYTREIIARQLAESGAFEAAKEAGISQKELTDAVLEGGDALESVRGKINENTQGWEGLVGMFGGAGARASSAAEKITSLNGSLVQSGQDFEDQKAAGDGAVQTLDEIANQSADTQDAVAELSDELRNFGKATLDLIDAEQQFQESLRGVSDRLGEEGFKGGLDLATEAGSKNMDVLTDIARATNEFAAATYDSTGSVDELNGVLVDGRKSLVDTAKRFGATTAEAEAFADSVLATPKQVTTRVSVDNKGALTAIQAIKNALSSVTGAIATVTVKQGKAAGGAIYGPGTGTSDEAGLFHLSNGEHVLTAADVKAMGGQAGVYALRQSLYKGYASGGAVQYAPASYSGPASTSTTRVGGSVTVQVENMFGSASQVAADIRREQRYALVAEGVDGIR